MQQFPCACLLAGALVLKRARFKVPKTLLTYLSKFANKSANNKLARARAATFEHAALDEEGRRACPKQNQKSTMMDFVGDDQ